MNQLRRASSLAVVIAVSTLSFAAYRVQANEIIEDLKKLPSEFSEVANKGKLELGHLVSEAIFDQINKIDIVEVPLGSQGKLGVSIGRTVLSNADVEQSYTVVDKLRLPLSFPALSLPLGSELVTFDVGLKGSVDFTNIRIVKPQDQLYTARIIEKLREGKDLDRRQEQLEDSEWLKLAMEQLQKSGESFHEVKDEDDKPVFFLDSLRRARYGRIWNMVSAPLRIPFRASWLSRLAEREVVTYSGTGTIEVGPSAGVHYETPDGRAKVNLGAKLRAYLRGDFRIAIIKTGPKKARVKVTRGHSRGFQGNIGGSASGLVFEGFMIAGSDIGKLTTSLIPISFSGDKSWGESFEVGYEYDLNDELAIEAYEQAVLGRLGLSEELSQEMLAPKKSAKPRTAAVTKIFSKDEDFSSRHKRVGIRLTVLSRAADSTFAIQDARIQFPEGESHVFKAKNDVTFTKELNFIFWKSKESAKYSVQADFIRGIDSPDTKGRLGLIAEGRIHDNSTSGIELNRYAEMVESLFGDTRIFPAVDSYLPMEDEPEQTYIANEGAAPTQEPQLHMTYYGLSEFYFRVGLSQEQVIKLMLTPEDSMWKYLEAGFERPAGVWSGGRGLRWMSAAGGWLYNIFGWLFTMGDIDSRLGIRYYHAKSFQEEWAEARKLILKHTSNGLISLPSDARKALTERLGLMFKDSVFSYELIKTTMLALRDQGEKDISFRIHGRSSAFPPVTMEGGSITEIERATERYADETEFDSPRVRRNADLEVTKLKAAVKAGNRVEISFEAAKDPTMVLIRIDEISDYLAVENTVKQLLIPNRGQFKAGPNRFVLELRKRNSPASDVAGTFETELASSLERDTNYRISITLLDGSSTGAPQSSDFFVNE